MNIAATKLTLIQQILETDSEEIINHIKAVFDSQKDDWWDTLPDEVKKSVAVALKQADNGELIPHSEVMKRYAKWLS